MFNLNNTFHHGEAFINSGNGEFVQFDAKNRKFIESKGLQILNQLKGNEINALFALGKDKREFAALAKEIGETEMVAKKAFEGLVIKGLAAKEKVAGENFYSLNKEIDLPESPLHPFLKSLGSLPVSMAEALSLEMEKVPKQKVIDALVKRWKRLVVKEVKDIYLPFYETILRMPDGKLRMIRIDAVNGKPLSEKD